MTDMKDAFCMVMVVAAVAGWAIIEIILWLLSFIAISIG